MLTHHDRTGPTRTATATVLLTAALLSLLLLGSALSPSHAEAFATKSGVFKVKINGIQTNKWFTDKSPKFDCDWYAKGSGWERVMFNTPFRKMRISAFGTKRADSAIFAPLPARGKVMRQGKLTTDTSNVPENCRGDGGDGPAPPPPPPDCGTKPIRNTKLALVALKGKLTLDRKLTRDPAKDPFRNCDWKGKAWPGLLQHKGKVRISTPFRPRWVFNRNFNRRTGEWSKVIMIARGIHTNRDFDGWYKSSIRWTVTMKRLR